MIFLRNEPSILAVVPHESIRIVSSLLVEQLVQPGFIPLGVQCMMSLVLLGASRRPFPLMFDGTKFRLNRRNSLMP